VILGTSTRRARATAPMNAGLAGAAPDSTGQVQHDDEQRHLERDPERQHHRHHEAHVQVDLDQVADVLRCQAGPPVFSGSGWTRRANSKAR
jgi:hypothetical protein